MSGWSISVFFQEPARLRVAERLDERPSGAAEAHHRDAEPREVRHRHQARDAAAVARPPPPPLRGLPGRPRAGTPRRRQNSTSPEATAFVPSFSLSWRIWMPLRVPSRRCLSTRNVATPRMLSGAPIGFAMTTNASPSRFEENHLKPFKRQASPSGVAVVSSAPRSEPPVRSVKNWPSCRSTRPIRASRARAGGCPPARTARPGSHHPGARAHRARHADLGLVEQVALGEARTLRSDTRVARGLNSVLRRKARRDDRVLRAPNAVGNDDLAHVMAPPVVLDQVRRIAVGLLRAGLDRPAHERAPLGKVRAVPRRSLWPICGSVASSGEPDHRGTSSGPGASETLGVIAMGLTGGVGRGRSFWPVG